MNPRRLIVSADDFGLTAAVDRGIVAGVAAGSVTSVGVMANLVGAEAMAELLATDGALSIGVHLNLTTGRPVVAPAEVPSLVDAHGVFHPLPALARRALAGRVRTDEVRRELAAQIARVRALGATVDHLDSHEHVHLVPPITGVVVGLARTAGVPRMRTHRPRLLGGGLRSRLGYYTRHPRRIATHALKRLFARRLAAAGIATPDGMVAASLLAEPVGGGPAREWERIVATLPAGTWELVVHPADLDVPERPGEAGRLGELVERRAAELAALVAPAFRAVVGAHGVALVPFAAIPARATRAAARQEAYAAR